MRLSNIIEPYDVIKKRSPGEGGLLVFGEKITMKRRGGCNQVKGVVTCVYQNYLDGSIQCDIISTQGASHLKISELDVVKSAGDTYSRTA